MLVCSAEVPQSTARPTDMSLRAFSGSRKGSKDAPKSSSTKASKEAPKPSKQNSASTTASTSASASSCVSYAAVPAPENGNHNHAAHSDMVNGDQYFSSHQMKALQEAFEFFDIDHDGRITSNELHKVLKFLGSKVTEHEVKLMIADVDSDGNGTVEFNEFLKMMKKYYRKNSNHHSEDADMWEAFKAFDHNGDNFIDFAEIKKTMHFLGEEVSDEDVRSMIAEADVDNDGKINFEEFKKMMTIMQQRSEGQPS